MCRSPVLRLRHVRGRRLAVLARRGAYQDIKICMSEGGIGWVPGLLDRLDHMDSYNDMYGTWTRGRNAVGGAATELLVLRGGGPVRRSRSDTASAWTTFSSSLTTPTAIPRGPARKRSSKRARRPAGRRHPQNDVGERFHAVPAPGPRVRPARPERILRSFVGLGGLSPAPNHHGAAAGTGTGRDQMVPGAVPNRLGPVVSRRAATKRERPSAPPSTHA